TGRGRNGRPDAAHLYWNSGAYIWDNDGDTATLRSVSGRISDSCTWTGVGTGVTSCGFVPAPPAPSVSVSTAQTLAPPICTPTPPPTQGGHQETERDPRAPRHDRADQCVGAAEQRSARGQHHGEPEVEGH